MKKFLENLAIYEKAGVVPLVMGPSGWGKSDGVRQYARQTGRPCLEFYASMIGAEDIGGFPFVVNGVLHRANDYALEQALNKPVVLFLDEINQARPDVINAMFPILRECKVNGRDLDPATFIVCAGNEIDDNPYLTELPPAFVNRSEKCPPPQSWSDCEDYLSAKFNMPKDKIKRIRKVSAVSNPARLERIVRLLNNGATRDILTHILNEMVASQLLKESVEGVSSIYSKIIEAKIYASSPIIAEDGVTTYPTKEMVMQKFGLTEDQMRLVPLGNPNSRRV